jgi:hypothetical protein
MKFMQKLFTLSCAAVLVFMVSSTAFAQRRPNYTEVGGALGISNYNGDFSASSGSFPVSQLSSLVHNDLGMSVFLQHHFHPHLSVKPMLSYYRLWASDKNSFDDSRKIRDGGFRADLFEGSLIFVWDFIGTYRGFRYRPKFNFYAFAGVGFAYVRGTGSPGLDLNNVRGSVNNYSLVTLAVPFGVGIKYRLTERWNLGAEVGIRFTGNNRIDNYDAAVGLAGASGVNAPTVARGNDWYGFQGITLSYILFNPDQCPKPARAKKRFLGIKF